MSYQILSLVQSQISQSLKVSYQILARVHCQPTRDFYNRVLRKNQNKSYRKGNQNCSVTTGTTKKGCSLPSEANPPSLTMTSDLLSDLAFHCKLEDIQCLTRNQNAASTPSSPSHSPVSFPSPVHRELYMICVTSIA